MRDGKNLAARPDLQSLQVGLDGHIFEQPADRTSAIECALRSAQYFKPFEIERQQVECESLGAVVNAARSDRRIVKIHADGGPWPDRSEEHTSELQSLMRISYADFCLKKKKIRVTSPRLAHRYNTTTGLHHQTDANIP